MNRSDTSRVVGTGPRWALNTSLRCWLGVRGRRTHPETSQSNVVLFISTSCSCREVMAARAAITSLQLQDVEMNNTTLLCDVSG